MYNNNRRRNIQGIQRGETVFPNFISRVVSNFYCKKGDVEQKKRWGRGVYRARISMYNYITVKLCEDYLVSSRGLCGCLRFTMSCYVLTLHKKWSFPLRISSVNVTKSAVSKSVVFFVTVLSKLLTPNWAFALSHFFEVIGF